MILEMAPTKPTDHLFLAYVVFSSSNLFNSHLTYNPIVALNYLIISYVIKK